MDRRSEQLGTQKVSRLLVNLSVPATVGMMVNALYNLVDTIFIGRGVNALAIGGLAIAFPIQMLIMAFALMIGLGSASAVSRSLGAGDVELADHVTGNSFLAIAVLSSLMAVIGLMFVEPLLILFGATEALLPYAKEYITVILLGSIFFSFTVSTNNLVRAEGNAKVAMLTMIIGTGLNILLDPVFIFVFDMGIRGAALATVLSQTVSFTYILTYMYRGHSSLKVKAHHLRPDFDILKEIFAVGSAAFARQVSGSLVAIVVNNALKLYGGSYAITILGIVNRLIAFMIMPLFGVVQGMQPIAGFNYGARNAKRVKEVVKLTLLIATGIGTIGWAVMQLMPQLVLQIFTRDPEIVSEGTSVIRLVTLVIPVVSVQIVGASLFQSFGKAVPSLLLSLLRQVLLFIPLVFILPGPFGLGLLGVWLAFPISDLVSTVVTALLMLRQMRRLRTELGSSSESDHSPTPSSQ